MIIRHFLHTQADVSSLSMLTEIFFSNFGYHWISFMDFSDEMTFIDPMYYEKTLVDQ